jgi:hypothetical protein
VVTKYFIDAQGNYIGGFNGVEPPEGSIEVNAPPPHGWQKWDFDNQEWLPLTPEQIAELNLND